MHKEEYKNADGRYYYVYKTKHIIIVIIEDNNDSVIEKKLSLKICNSLLINTV